jgi:RNA polymerase sigma factor (sigma-70 family)
MEVKNQLTEKGQRDYLLVKKAFKGDQEAYTELMTNYKDSLYFMLLKMTNNATDAEDLTIEAFGKAFKNIHSYSPDFAFSTWLFRIATNSAIDYIRKKKQMNLSIDKPYLEEEGGSEISQNIGSDIHDPEELYMIDQKKELMREIVEKLKPHYKKLVLLRYFDEFSYEEIAEELNLPLGTVKAKLFRAREFLHNILKDSKDKI